MAKTIELTEEQLHSLVATAVTAALSARGPQAPAQPVVAATPDEQFEAMQRGRKARSAEIPVEIVTGIKSGFTGATFDAEIQRGIVVNLQSYTYPVGYDLSVDDGGLVPRGRQIRNRDSGQPTTDFKQYLWENYLQQDLRTFIGKPLPKHVRAEAQETAAAE